MDNTNMPGMVSSAWSPLRTLETSRLLLRAFEESDAEDVFAYAKNPRIGPPAGWSPHLCVEESQRIIRVFMQGTYTWAIVLKESGRVIGSVDLHPDTKRTIESSRMIGYVLDEPYWGQGLTVEAVRAVMGYAFRALRLDILSAVCFPYNVRSRRVMEKCGMQYEGTFRMATRVFSGEVYDDVCFSITRDEWLGQKSI